MHSDLGSPPGEEHRPRFISRSSVMEFQLGPHDCDQSAFQVSFQSGGEVVVDEQPVGVGLGEGDCLIPLHQVLQGGGRRLGHVLGAC